MNYRVLARLLSTILAALGVAQLLCLGVGLWVGEWSSHPRALLGLGLSAGLGFLFALGLWLAAGPVRLRLFRREALALIGLGWLLASALGALPFWLILPDCRPADAFFESASGFTTTGASVFLGFEEWPRSLLFWRSLTQWIGGLGVVVFFVAILGSLGVGAKIIISRESSTDTSDLGSAKVRSGITRIFYLYLVLSAACALALHLCGMSWYDALCHTFATLSTGGFSTRSASVAAFASPAVEWVLIVFMFLGGCNFLLLLRLSRRDFGFLQRNSEFHFYLFLIASSTAVITLKIIEQTGSPDGLTALRTALFQVISILTTTGFGTADFDQWLPPARIILLLLMVAGGCTGSTAGGIKVLRFLILWKMTRRHVERSFRPHVIRPIKINGKVLHREAQDSALSFINTTLLVTALGILSVSLLEPTLSPLGAISAVFASLFNIGPGLAEVGPMANFAFLHDYTKILLALLMILGRLELFALLVLLVPSFWRRFS